MIYERSDLEADSLHVIERHLIASAVVERFWCKVVNSRAAAIMARMTTTPARTADLFKGRQFDHEIIVLCVKRWSQYEKWLFYLPALRGGGGPFGGYSANTVQRILQDGHGVPSGGTQGCDKPNSRQTSLERIQHPCSAKCRSRASRMSSDLIRAASESRLIVS